MLNSKLVSEFDEIPRLYWLISTSQVNVHVFLASSPRKQDEYVSLPFFMGRCTLILASSASRQDEHNQTNRHLP